MAYFSWPNASDMQRWLAVDETAKTMLRRLQERCAPSIAPMPPLHKTTLHGRNVLEIAGPSGSGKSELLLQSVVSCILPKEWEGLSLGGSEKPVLYLDLDCRFDIRRLVHLLECRIYDAESRLYDIAWDMYNAGGGQTLQKNINSDKQRVTGTAVQRFPETSARTKVEGSYSAGGDSSIKPIIKACLRRFYLRRCRSSFEFLVAVKKLRVFMYQVLYKHGSTPELLIFDRIRAIVCDLLLRFWGQRNYEVWFTTRTCRCRSLFKLTDWNPDFSIGAFYWLERATRSASAQPSRKTFNLWTVSDAVVEELKFLVEFHPKLLIMATKTLILKVWQKEKLSTWKGGRIGRRNQKMHRPGYKKIPHELFKSDEHSSRSTKEEGVVEKSVHRDFLPASWRGFVTHRIILQGPYQSELASTDRFLKLCPSFFTAEWDKPFSDLIDFFVIQDDGIKLAN